MGWVMGLEPTTPGATVQCSTIELHPPSLTDCSVFHRANMVRQEGFEPPTCGLEGRRSIHLSYWRPGSSVWSGREDSNLRLPAPKAGALPNCATPRETSNYRAVLSEGQSALSARASAPPSLCRDGSPEASRAS